jgi:hypothetical protein
MVSSRKGPRFRVLIASFYQSKPAKLTVAGIA